MCKCHISQIIARMVASDGLFVVEVLPLVNVLIAPILALLVEIITAKVIELYAGILLCVCSESYVRLYCGCTSNPRIEFFNLTQSHDT